MKRRAFLAAAIAAAVARPPDGRAGVLPGGSDAGTGPLPSRPGTAADSPPERCVVASISVPDGRKDLSGGIDAAVAAVAGGAGWGAIAGPGDRIAIKLNCLAGPRLAPDRRLVDAIVRGLVSAGVDRGGIVIFDRTSRELAAAGYPERRDPGDVRCFGTDALRGGGYVGEILEHRSIGSLFSRILTDHATVLINVGGCKDHDLCGVSAGLKNLYGLIHNPNRYHADGCDPFLADLADHPAVRPKLRLTVVDAIVAQCHGGPAYNPAYAFRPGRVLMTRDGLAADVVAREWIEAERARRGLSDLAADKREPKWIATAARIGVGTGDRERIAVREIAG